MSSFLQHHYSHRREVWHGDGSVEHTWSFVAFYRRLTISWNSPFKGRVTDDAEGDQ